MRLSQHCISRSSQRGISRHLIEILYHYGRTRYANGACVTDMDRNGILAFLTEEPAAARKMIDKLRSVYLVSVDETQVTAARKDNSFKLKFK